MASSSFKESNSMFANNASPSTIRSIFSSNMFFFISSYMYKASYSICKDPNPLKVLLAKPLVSQP